MSIYPLSLYHSKDVLLHLDGLTNLKIGLLGLCVGFRMTLMAIRATADSDLLHGSEQPVARQHRSGLSCFVADNVICKWQPSQFISTGMAGSLDGLATSLWCVWSCLGLHWLF